MINRMHIAPFALLGSHSSLWRIFVALALLLCSVSIALAGPREQAARIHDRLAGVPADEATLDAMAATLPSNPTAAANIAMSNPNFYAVTLKNFAAPWTNRDQNRVRAAQRLRDARDGHGPRQRAVQSDSLGQHALHRAERLAGAHRPRATRTSKRSRTRMRDPAFNQSELRADDADRDLRHARRGDGRRDDDARRGRSVLHRGHEPRDVPLHAR